MANGVNTKDHLQELEVDGEMVFAIYLKNCVEGEYLKRKPNAKTVYRRSTYDRSERKYWIDSTEDISKGMLLKGDTIVYVGFSY